MHSQQRALLAVTLAVLTIVASAGTLAIGTVGAQAGNDSTETPTATTTITVSTSGQASAEPDLVVVHVASMATADTPGEATERLAANTSTLRSALSEAGIPEDAVRTTDFSIEEVRPDFEGPDRGPPAARADNVSYRATQGFEIEVENTSRAGEVVDLAVANGATSVRGVEFRLSPENRSELRQVALERAAESARTQAETLAAAESLSITGVDAISTGESFFGPAGVESADGGGGTTIDGGPVSVSVSVTITYEAEPR